MFFKILLIWLVAFGALVLNRKFLDLLQAKSDPFDKLRTLYARKDCPCKELILKVFSEEKAMKLHRDQNKRLGDSKQKDIYLKIYEQILLNVEVLNTYLIHYDEESDKYKIQEQVKSISKLIDQLHTLDNLYLELDAKATLGDPNEIDDLIDSLKEMVEG